MDFYPIRFSFVRDKHDAIVRRCDKNLIDVIVFDEVCAETALAASPLAFILRRGKPLDIAEL